MFLKKSNSIDVKFGSGAFMKDIKSAEELASTMVEIGKHLNRDTKAVLTDMDQPLGMAIGNSLEVIEACETLKGRGPKDLVELCLNLGAIILKQAHIEEDIEKGKVLLQSKIDNLEAFKKLEELIKYQGGDISYLEDYSKFEKSKYQKEIYSSKEGYVEKISALEIGECAMHLGAGRATKDDVIDMSSGIVLNKKVGDFVKKGELLLTCYTNKENVEEIYKDLENSYIIVQNKVPNHKIIHEIIG